MHQRLIEVIKEHGTLPGEIRWPAADAFAPSVPYKQSIERLYASKVIIEAPMAQTVQFNGKVMMMVYFAVCLPIGVWGIVDQRKQQARSLCLKIYSRKPYQMNIAVRPFYFYSTGVDHALSIAQKR